MLNNVLFDYLLLIYKVILTFRLQVAYSVLDNENHEYNNCQNKVQQNLL